MRALPVLLAALAVAALAAPPAAAQPQQFTQGYQVRIGSGDIPTTAIREPAGWSVEQRLLFHHTQGTSEPVTLPTPASSHVVDNRCDCNFTAEPGQGSVTFRIAPSEPTRDVTLTLSASAPATEAFALQIPLPRADAIVILYLPNGVAVHAAAAATSPGPSTDGTATIQVYGEPTPLPNPFWLSLNPASAEHQTAARGLPWVLLAAAFLAGAVLWGVLVARGVVQKRTRKQTVAASAHSAIAASDPPAVLDGKKRALLAALKEVEVAKMNGEMDSATYDVVKAEFKRQAVTVMRAREGSDANA